MIPIRDEIFVNQGLILQGPKTSAPLQRFIKLGSYTVEPEWKLHDFCLTRGLGSVVDAWPAKYELTPK